jgi:hypothetical protein
MMSPTKQERGKIDRQPLPTNPRRIPDQNVSCFGHTVQIPF